MARKKAVKVKKYKSIQTATVGRRQKGSTASSKTSTAVSRASKIQRKSGAAGPGSLSDIIVRTINGIKTPINTSSDKKKKRS